ncbi:hypothetical protein CR194_16725 [Salipaludibacillus keqinensis]|uniref:Uncharacterized protein n=1 Tax=Salipaludibacillus keqinensis TaxID=2045207 RepID=A0A323TR88_9BACI|nr:hypothetical protein [Salipaludibacillus keqinensis]PYZ91855.1 hypothetical protein CR194_16725 [Salipaludibacillus keqinensis]
MGINRYYWKTSKPYFLLGSVFLLVFLVMLFLTWLDISPFYLWDDLPVYLFTFTGGFAFIVAGAMKLKRAKQNRVRLHEQSTSVNFLTLSRFILIPHVHWLREYELFSLEGESIGRVREDVKGWKKSSAFFLHLIKIRWLFKKTIIVENDDNVLYYMRKDSGIHQIYRIYNKEEEHLITFKMNVFNLLHQYAEITNPKGQLIGMNDGGFSGREFKVVNNQGNRMVELKYDGIPIEALKLFSGTRGDIIDIYHDQIDDCYKEAIILAPIVVQLHFKG